MLNISFRRTAVPGISQTESGTANLYEALVRGTIGRYRWELLKQRVKPQFAGHMGDFVVGLINIYLAPSSSIAPTLIRLEACGDGKDAGNQETQAFAASHATPSSTTSAPTHLRSLHNMGILGKIQFYFKSTIFGSLIAVCAMYGVVASIILRVIGKEQYSQYTVARVFHYLFSKLLGIKVTVRNEHYLQTNHASVVVSNHQSALDILILGRVFQPGTTVTAKKVLKYFPFLGWFMIASGTFFLDRARGEKARRVLEAGLAQLKEKQRSIFMFPEGTRSATKKLELLPFKKGAFHLAKQAGIPVVPVVVPNYSSLFCSRDKIFRQGEIVVEVLQPMPTTELQTNDDVTAFANEVREKMLHKIEEIGYASASGLAMPSNEDVSDTLSEGSVEIIEELTPLITTD